MEDYTKSIQLQLCRELWVCACAHGTLYLPHTHRHTCMRAPMLTLSRSNALLLCILFFFFWFYILARTHSSSCCMLTFWLEIISIERTYRTQCFMCRHRTLLSIPFSICIKFRTKYKLKFNQYTPSTAIVELSVSHRSTGCIEIHK